LPVKIRTQFVVKIQTQLLGILVGVGIVAGDVDGKVVGEEVGDGVGMSAGDGVGLVEGDGVGVGFK